MEPDRGLRDADVGLAADDNRRPAPVSRTAVRISGVPASPKVGFRKTGVPAGRSLDESGVGRAVPLRLLLRHDDRDREPRCERDEPRHARERRARRGDVVLREPRPREETRLRVDDDEDGVVPVEQAHVPPKSTSFVSTVPAVRPGAVWLFQYRFVCAITCSGGGAPHSVRSSVVCASLTSVASYPRASAP